MLPGFSRTLALILLLVLLTGCISKNRTIQPGSGPSQVDALATNADQIYATQPHTEANIAQAYALMDRAARGARDTDPRRYEYLWKTMRLTTWLADHVQESKQRSDYAKEGIDLGNTAVQLKEDGVEGHYYRAISVGLFARENELYGMDAMRQMQTEAMRAIDLDPSFDFAGPHRLLGALYLRAPGPPTGVGSVIKSIRYLKNAVEMAPDYPPNTLFLAEAYIKNGQNSDADALLSKLLQSPLSIGDDLEKEEWREEALALQSKTKE